MKDKINMSDRLFREKVNCFAITNDLQTEETDKYVKLLLNDKVVAFIDKSTGDVLKKRTRNVPSKEKIGNVNMADLWKVTSSSMGNYYKGRILYGPVKGKNVVLKSGSIETVIDVTEILEIDKNELRIRGSNLTLVLRKVEE